MSVAALPFLLIRMRRTCRPQVTICLSARLLAEISRVGRVDQFAHRPKDSEPKMLEDRS